MGGCGGRAVDAAVGVDVGEVFEMNAIPAVGLSPTGFAVRSLSILLCVSDDRSVSCSYAHGCAGGVRDSKDLGTDPKPRL